MPQMKVKIATTRTIKGEKTYEVNFPAIPREGDHISSDLDDYSGYVKSVSFWQNEKGVWQIEVRIS